MNPKFSGVLITGMALLLCGCRESQNPTLKFKAFIDGKDIVKVQGSKIWYEHQEATLPGDPEHRHDSTFINSIEWQPKWNDKTSAPFENLYPAFEPSLPAQVKIAQAIGRGEVTITELPSAENNKTLSFCINDEAPGGEWYEVVLEWKQSSR